MSSITRDIAFVRYRTAISARAAPSSSSRSISPDHEPRLGVLVVERAHVDLLTLPELAPQPLGDPAAVVGDHGVGGADRIVSVER